MGNLISKLGGFFGNKQSHVEHVRDRRAFEIAHAKATGLNMVCKAYRLGLEKAKKAYDAGLQDNDSDNVYVPGLTEAHNELRIIEGYVKKANTELKNIKIFKKQAITPKDMAEVEKKYTDLYEGQNDGKNRFAYIILRRERKNDLGDSVLFYKKAVKGNFGSMEYFLPGGLVDKGENMNERVIRALKEDTSIDIKNAPDLCDMSDRLHLSDVVKTEDKIVYYYNYYYHGDTSGKTVSVLGTEDTHTDPFCWLSYSDIKENNVNKEHLEYMSYFEKKEVIKYESIEII